MTNNITHSNRYSLVHSAANRSNRLRFRFGYSVCVCVFFLIFSLDCTSTSYQVDFCVQFVFELCVCQGSLPVGEIGKLLQEATANASLSQTLKDQFGGLKKFLEKVRSALDDVVTWQLCLVWYQGISNTLMTRWCDDQCYYHG